MYTCDGNDKKNGATVTNFCFILNLKWSSSSRKAWSNSIPITAGIVLRRRVVNVVHGNGIVRHYFKVLHFLIMQ